MAKYRNKTAREILLPSPNGMIRIAPGAVLELDYGLAKRGFPYLIKEEDTRQILVEAPLPVEEVPVETPVEEEEVPEVEVEEVKEEPPRESPKPKRSKKK